MDQFEPTKLSRPRNANIPNNVPMLHFFQEGNLSYGSARHPLIVLLQSNFLQRYGLICDTITSLVNHPISAFTYLLNFLVLENSQRQR